MALVAADPAAYGRWVVAEQVGDLGCRPALLGAQDHEQAAGDAVGAVQQAQQAQQVAGVAGGAGRFGVHAGGRRLVAAWSGRCGRKLQRPARRAGAGGLMRASRAVLDGVVGRLRSLLEPLGFDFAHGDQGVGSGGRFATGSFSRAPFRIELIVRGGRLGLPNYRWDRALAGHDDLVRALGRHDEAHLLWDESAFQVVTRDGEAAVDGLIADLAGIIVPVLQTSPDALREATATAHAAFQRRLRGSRRRSR
jgi:hypothetical protein